MMDATFRALLRQGLRVYLGLLRLAAWVGSPPAAVDRPVDVLLTLQFQAPGWPQALLGPLAASHRCRRLCIVTTAETPAMDGVEVVQPPPWLMATCGATIARLLTFAAVAVRSRPRIVGGVHLLFNGLVASLVARLVGARSLYLCVGGPNEVAGGGILSENRVFGRLSQEDATIERLLLEAVSSFDRVVTMGTRASEYFRSRGIKTPIFVVPSGVDGSRFPMGGPHRDVDVILVARLAPVKRIDLFVRTIRKVADLVPSVRAVIIGTGQSRQAAETLALELNLANHLVFLGHVPDVSVWYGRAKVFLLTSDTEGVSISLIEAMLCGAVPVVSDVGDLADAVAHGENGMRVGDRSPEGFAGPVADLLTGADRWAAMSASARQAAGQFAPAAIARRWDTVLSEKVLHGNS